MKVNSDQRVALDKLKNDQLQKNQGGERFGKMVVKQEKNFTVSKLRFLRISAAGDRCPIS